MNENKLIAEFMGMELKPNECGRLFRYHKSWDWLMPVAIKCFDNHFENSDDLNFKLNDALLETNIESLYKAVVEFIKEYNRYE